MKAIDKFLEDWKNKAREYYVSKVDEYTQLWNEYSKALVKYEQAGGMEGTETDQLETAHNNLKDYQNNPPYSKSIFKIVERVYLDRKYKSCSLDSFLDKDVAAKKENFISRIQKKSGSIKNADLYIGVDGSINGTVTGEDNTVSVYSIIAGGWNVQVAHYRVLINTVKEGK
tara:strand:+ start:4102 stop:4614 length:513 start_codon:yes stop_codon:yes gene_type:complete